MRYIQSWNFNEKNLFKTIIRYFWFLNKICKKVFVIMVFTMCMRGYVNFQTVLLIMYLITENVVLFQYWGLGVILKSLAQFQIQKVRFVSVKFENWNRIFLNIYFRNRQYKFEYTVRLIIWFFVPLILINVFYGMEMLVNKNSVSA